MSQVPDRFEADAKAIGETPIARPASDVSSDATTPTMATHDISSDCNVQGGHSLLSRPAQPEGRRSLFRR